MTVSDHCAVVGVQCAIVILNTHILFDMLTTAESRAKILAFKIQLSPLFCVLVVWCVSWHPFCFGDPWVKVNNFQNL